MRVAVGGLIGCLLVACPAAQERPASMSSRELAAHQRAPAVSFSAQVVARSLNYGMAALDTATILSERVDGPLRIEIVVANTTGARVDIGRTGKSWLDFVSVRLLADPDNRPEDMGNTTLRLLRPMQPGIFAVESDRPQTFQAALILTERGSLRPGLYELHVALHPASLSPVAARFGSTLSSTTRLRIKVPTTPDERVDMFLQRSFQSKVEARPAESRQWAERALAINPESIPAVLDIGSAWLAEESCSEAVPQYDKAIWLLQTGGDPRLRIDASDREAQVTVLRGQLAMRC